MIAPVALAALLFFGDPPAHDAGRLDPLRQASAAVQMNRAYRAHLEWCRLHLLVLDDEEYARRLTELDRRNEIWQQAYYAGCDHLSERSRRHYLARVRDLVGYDAYHRDDLPEPIPREWMVPVSE